MAAQVKLVRRRDFGSDISSLSLFNYEDGFSLTRDGWIQAVARDGDMRTSEAMTLRVEASSHDDLASTLQALDDKLREVAWYNDAAERYGVWLRAQLPDETEARQALITQAGGEIGSPVLAPPLSPGNALRQYHLALERIPFWEATSHITFNVDYVNCTGGQAYYVTTDPPGEIYGDVPARLASLSFKGRSGGGTLYEFWLGFRTDRFGVRGNFAPVWECEDGSLDNDTTSVADATAHGGYKAECTFDGSAAMLERATVAIEDVTTNYADQRGSFIVLLRAKVDSGTTCRVRLFDGFESTAALGVDAQWRSQQRVIVDSTSWLLHPLGTIDIPPSGDCILSDSLRHFALMVKAERTAGSDSLHLDSLILIPQGEGAVYAGGGGVQYSVPGDPRPIKIRHYADGPIAAWAYYQNMPIVTANVEPHKYGLPVGIGDLVLAGQGASSHTLTDAVDIELQIYPRYRTLRGAE